ncbi:MAG: glycosyl hydrolase 53 family protein [Bacteroidales bacterium]|nr:glycosyl hydrolase 53 family protein [Bacteroidales bacterium]
MRSILFILALTGIAMLACNKNEADGNDDPRVFYSPDTFLMGADLSYVNEILEHGGVYIDSGKVTDPYRIFSKYGTGAVRFRLFHNPQWTADLYGGGKMYHDFEDVKLGIQRTKDEGMRVLLDFHYSDNWADPGKQFPPSAWQDLSPETLGDSIYNYTFNTLKKLDNEGLMPEYVQVGNEINPGFVLPPGNRWDNTAQFVSLINRAITAVRDAAAQSTVDTEVLIHIAQPENVRNWFTSLVEAGLAEYDIIGFSYYYMWSSVLLNDVSDYVREFKETFGKDVMVLETAYPWTLENADAYPNIMDADKLVPNYPATEAGQYKYLKKLTQEIIDGGGKGIFYWEPAWISSNAKTQWGTGSAFDSNTFFDFQGNVLQGMDYMTFNYNF